MCSISVSISPLRRPQVGKSNAPYSSVPSRKIPASQHRSTTACTAGVRLTDGRPRAVLQNWTMERASSLSTALASRKRCNLGERVTSQTGDRERRLQIEHLGFAVERDRTRAAVAPRCSWQQVAFLVSYRNFRGGPKPAMIIWLSSAIAIA